MLKNSADRFKRLQVRNSKPGGSEKKENRRTKGKVNAESKEIEVDESEEVRITPHATVAMSFITCYCDRFRNRDMMLKARTSDFMA